MIDMAEVLLYDYLGYWYSKIESEGCELVGLYYIQTNVICLAILFIVNVILNRSNILPARRVAFRKLVLICAVVCISDIFAWFFSGKLFPGSKLLVYITNMVYYAAITWEGYAWLNYVNLRINTLEENFRRRRIIDALPLALMLLIIAVNPFTQFLFSVNDACTYERGPGVVLHWIVSWGYLLYVTVKVLIYIRKAETNVEKSQYFPLLWFVIPPVIAAVFQMLFYGVTSTQCGFTLSILIIAFSFLSNEVSLDALTGLNNRRAFENHLMEQLQRCRTSVTVLMCDIDHFKNINDTMGHTAGDLVLKRMASSMKKVCGSYSHDVFLCRYGGDEFVICGYNLSSQEMKRLVEEVEKAIMVMNSDYADDLCFGISVGTASGVCDSFRDVEGLISLADAAMYERKRHKKESGAEFTVQ